MERKIQCKFNEKIISLAIINYEMIRKAAMI